MQDQNQNGTQLKMEKIQTTLKGHLLQCEGKLLWLNIRAEAEAVAEVEERWLRRQSGPKELQMS
jgi:hypothetical protein